jgi:hypothetical protein
MPAHRRLFTVIRDLRWRQTAGNKIRRVLVDVSGPFSTQYCRSLRQMEA